MLKTLIKKQLLELFQSYFIDRKTGKARDKKGTLIFFGFLIVLFGSLGMAFYSMASSLGVQILGHGINWIYFAVMSLLAMALGIFGSVFNTYASLYLPKDNELLMSLPIPPVKLLVARLFGVFFTSFMYSAWVWIPVMIAYWVLCPVSIANIIFPIILTFVITLFVTILSCILGFVVAIVASKAKGKSFLTVFLSLFVMAAYYFCYFKIAGSLGEIVNNLDKIGLTLKTRLHYIYLVGSAADGDFLSMVLVTAITIAVAIITVVVLSKTLFKFAFSGETATGKSKKTEKFTEQSISKALLKREMKHFTSVPTWMLNGGFGLLIMVIAGAAALIKSAAVHKLISQFTVESPELAIAFPVLILVGLCFMISSNSLASVSISMEGKSLWIVQSLPIDPWIVLRAKERMSFQLNIYPAVFCVVAAGIAFRLEYYEIVLTVCAAIAFILLSTDFGLFLNLKSPDFNWTNAASLTKQSMPVMINLFGGWIVCAALGFGGYYLCSISNACVALIAFMIVFIALRIVLNHWLRTKGTEIFRTL